MKIHLFSSCYIEEIRRCTTRYHKSFFIYKLHRPDKTRI